MYPHLSSKLLLGETSTGQIATKEVSKIFLVIRHSRFSSHLHIACTIAAHSAGSFWPYTHLDRSMSIGKMVRIIVLTGVMTMQIHWFWLIAGLVPYTIKRQLTKDEQVLTVEAP